MSDASRRCDGVSRRGFLKVGVLTATGLTLADVLRLRARAAEKGKSSPAAARTLLFLDGGPSHIDTYDMKPDAPVEYRGQFGAIRTALAGVSVCEHLPHQARIMDKLTVIRSLAHKANDHVNGPHQMLT